MRGSPWIVYAGDAGALAIISIVGFVTHGETDLSFLPRFLAIYIPLIAAWLLIASFIRLFRPEITSDLKQLWRVPLAMLIAGPLAVTVRALILQTEIIPVFIVALGGTATLALMIWRALYPFLKPNSADA
jgi:hypothetical protein